MDEIYKMEGGQLWDAFVGSQTVKEFINFKPNDTIEVAVSDYIKNQEEFFEDLGEETIEYIKARLIDYIITRAEDWVPKKEKIYDCDFKKVINSNIPLLKIILYK